MKNISYNAIFQLEPEGGYTVYVPTLQGCVSYGETIEKATENIKEAVVLYIESLIAHNEELPIENTTFITNLDLKIPVHA